LNIEGTTVRSSTAHSLFPRALYCQTDLGHLLPDIYGILNFFADHLGGAFKKLSEGRKELVVKCRTALLCAANCAPNNWVPGKLHAPRTGRRTTVHRANWSTGQLYTRETGQRTTGPQWHFFTFWFF